MLGLIVTQVKIHLLSELPQLIEDSVSMSTLTVTYLSPEEVMEEYVKLQEESIRLLNIANHQRG